MKGVHNAELLFQFVELRIVHVDIEMDVWESLMRRYQRLGVSPIEITVLAGERGKRTKRHSPHASQTQQHTNTPTHAHTPTHIQT